MNCCVCKKTMDKQWIELQNTIKDRGNVTSYLTTAFVERCIYCYKQLLELTEQKEQDWYDQTIKAWDKTHNE
jgi:hypothetical protein